MYEGGIRVVGFIVSPLLKSAGRVYDGLLHASDWFSTLLNLAGGNLCQTTLRTGNCKIVINAGLGDSVPQDTDSFNVFDAISSDGESPRKRIIHTIDEDTPSGTWKVRKTDFI